MHLREQSLIPDLIWSQAPHNALSRCSARDGRRRIQATPHSDLPRWRHTCSLTIHRPVTSTIQSSPPRRVNLSIGVIRVPGGERREPCCERRHSGGPRTQVAHEVTADSALPGGRPAGRGIPRRTMRGWRQDVQRGHCYLLSPVRQPGSQRCRSTSRPVSGPRRQEWGICVLCCSTENATRLRSRSIDSNELMNSH